MLINVLFILIMIVSIILIARHEALSKSLKGFVISMLALAIFLAVIFEYGTQKNAQKIRPLVIAFKKGIPLYCKDEIITNQYYIYESGTSSLQPNDDIEGETYYIKDCTLTK